MSYDIAFKIKVEAVDAYVEVGDCDANITWNLREMIEASTGLPWLNEENNGLCTDVIPHIEHGLEELCKYPRKYKKYEASNGWGTVEGLKMFYARILDAWKIFKREQPELAKVATFWIY